MEKKYLLEPVPKQTQTINAAGSTITYGKRSGKEYIHIPGPINTPLRFMVKKIILKFIIWQSSSEVIPNVLIVFFLVFDFEIRTVSTGTIISLVFLSAEVGKFKIKKFGSSTAL